MELSVVILNYKVPYHLYLCVDSVVKAIEGLDAEIVVADNASADESQALITAHFPSVKWIQLNHNLGFSAGNNKAIEQAQGSYILVLNPDTFVGEHSIKDALQQAKQMSNLGALGVQLIDGRGGFLPESKRNFPSFEAVKSKFFGQGEAYYASSLASDQTGKVEVLVGAFMLMKRDNYQQVGGLDERYFMYGEDIDLSYQFIKNKSQNWYAGSISVVHFKGESTQKDKLYWQRFYEAMFLFYEKNYPKDAFKKGIIKLATRLVSRLKSSTHQPKNEAIKPDSWCLITTNTALKERLSSLLKSDVRLLSESEMAANDVNATCIIFDANELSYATIIFLMKRYKSENTYFRIIPRGASFMLGSDASDTKGEVLFL